MPVPTTSARSGQAPTGAGALAFKAARAATLNRASSSASAAVNAAVVDLGTSGR